MRLPILSLSSVEQKPGICEALTELRPGPIYPGRKPRSRVRFPLPAAGLSGF